MKITLFPILTYQALAIIISGHLPGAENVKKGLPSTIISSQNHHTTKSTPISKPVTNSKDVPARLNGHKPTKPQAASAPMTSKSNAKSMVAPTARDATSTKNTAFQAMKRGRSSLCKRGSAASCPDREEASLSTQGSSPNLRMSTQGSSPNPIITTQGSGSASSPNPRRLNISLSSQAIREHRRTTASYIQDNKTKFGLGLLNKMAPVLGGAAACSAVCCTGTVCGIPASGVAAAVLGGTAVAAGCAGGVVPDCVEAYEEYRAGTHNHAEEERRQTRLQVETLDRRLEKAETQLNLNRAARNIAFQGVYSSRHGALVSPAIQRMNPMSTQVPAEGSSRLRHGENRAWPGRAKQDRSYSF